jgi:hypothetical protein
MRILCFIAILSLVAAAAVGQESAGTLLQAGMYAEDVTGDLTEAFRLYRKVIELFPGDRVSGAKAQLRIAICTAKTDSGSAVREFRAVLANFPEQQEVVSEARRRLAGINHAESFLPHVQSYFERLGVDILTSTSYDGKWLAYTDWTTGSIVVRNLKTGRVRQVVPADFSHGDGFGFRPTWSRDGREIAYGWFVNYRCIDLRVVSIADTVRSILFHERDMLVSPQDWSADGTRILCILRKPDSPDATRLGIVRRWGGAVQDLLELSQHARGLAFSPDGRFIAYDGLVGDDRQIMVLNLQDSSVTQVSSGQFGARGIDAPVWSKDGGGIYFRSTRLGKYDLWRIPMKEGKPAGAAILVCSDLTNQLLALKGIKHEAPDLRPFYASMFHHSNVSSPEGFSEEFVGTHLDSAWRVFSWTQPNIYSYATFGRYSLKANPGSLRYWVDPITGRGFPQAFQAHFSGWYWIYPALELMRPLWGTHWVLDAKATYSLVDCVNGRGFFFAIRFDPEQDRGTALVIERGKDVRLRDNHHWVSMVDLGAKIASNDSCLSPADTAGVTRFTYFYRVTRDGPHLSVQIADDGIAYREYLSCTLPPGLGNVPQMISLSGISWFLPAGSYVDWDYIRFSPSLNPAN